LVDPFWPHIQPVYELFLQLIVNDAADVKTLKVFITLSFVQEVIIFTKFLEIIDSEEPKEREYLKNILHRLYAKVIY
jgi:serine/threonine-protein phosphatase 2A regulatory subunit B'